MQKHVNGGKNAEVWRYFSGTPPGKFMLEMDLKQSY